MRTLTICLLSVVCLLFSSVETYAQAHWEWGIGSQTNSPHSYLESWQITTDKNGNVFEAGYSENADSTIFGTIVVPNTGMLWVNQMLIAKADSAGHFLWAISH